VRRREARGEAASIERDSNRGARRDAFWWSISLRFYSAFAGEFCFDSTRHAISAITRSLFASISQQAIQVLGFQPGLEPGYRPGGDAGERERLIVLLICSIESLAECCAQFFQAVEELLALFPCAWHLAAGAPRQYLFPANLRSRPAGDVFIQPRSGTRAKAVLHIDQLDAVASLVDAANLTGRFLKSVFRREPGHTIGSQASNGNPLGIYRLGHCSLQRSLSLKPAPRLRSPRPTPDAQGHEDQQDHNDSTQAEPKQHGATTILPRTRETIPSDWGQ